MLFYIRMRPVKLWNMKPKQVKTFNPLLIWKYVSVQLYSVNSLIRISRIERWRDSAASVYLVAHPLSCCAFKRILHLTLRTQIRSRAVFASGSSKHIIMRSAMLYFGSSITCSLQQGGDTSCYDTHPLAGLALSLWSSPMFLTLKTFCPDPNIHLVSCVASSLMQDTTR